MDGANHLHFKLQMHYIENLKQIFPEMKLRGLDSQFLHHVHICERFIGIFPRSVLKRNTAK
jgi:hypothetical protein